MYINLSRISDKFMYITATWNSLSDELRNPDLYSATFRCNLKTFLFQQCLVHWAQ